MGKPGNIREVSTRVTMVTLHGIGQVIKKTGFSISQLGCEHFPGVIFQVGTVYHGLKETKKKQKEL